jgi:hypothetical protein
MKPVNRSLMQLSTFAVMGLGPQTKLRQLIAMEAL